MRAISLWQPWASAIAAGLKTIETRHWPTDYRGPLAIHAAKKTTRYQKQIWEDNVEDPKEVDARDHFRKIGILRWEDLPFGAIVATAELYGMASTQQISAEGFCLIHDRPWGDFTAGRYGWLLRNVQPITPIPCLGRQGFFDWEPPCP